MENETETGPSITVTDIANALRIIDAAAERGAYRGAELSQVGAVRDRLASFIAAVTPVAETAAEAEPDEVPEEVETPKKKKGK